MGPRKSQSPSAMKEEPNAKGRKSVSGKSGPAGGGSSTSAAAHDVRYTSEENAFLEAQLQLFKNGSFPPSGTSRDNWAAALPSLISITEKLLKASADQYAVVYAERAAATIGAGQGVTNGPSSNGGDTTEKQGGATSAMAPPPSVHGYNVNTSCGNIGTGTSVSQPLLAAGTPSQFIEENAYLVAQARQLQWYPFTYQRWLEILQNPAALHSSKDRGHLRGDALQASLRRCILVTYPAVDVGGPT